MPIALLAFVLFATTVVTGVSNATPSPDCQPLCAVQCLKPITIADRWDDETRVADYNEWLRNGFHDREQFQDLNGNYIYDAGEPFNDNNGNGVYDAEYYDPLLTGYLADQDLGRAFEIKAWGGPIPSPIVYFPINLPISPDPGEPAAYLWNWASCHLTVYGSGDVLWTQNGNLVGPTQDAVQSIYLLDPDAFWDPTCECVGGSDYDASPRLFIIAAHDPRIPIQAGKKVVHVRKLIGLFLESVTSIGFVVRFAEVFDAEGELCDGTTSFDAGFVFRCDPVQVEATTWGRIKAIHR